MLDGVMKRLKSVKNMSTVIIHLQKGVGSTAETGGGIRESVWRNLRQVRCQFLMHTYVEVLEWLTMLQFTLSALKMKELVCEIATSGRPPVVRKVCLFSCVESSCSPTRQVLREFHARHLASVGEWIKDTVRSC